MNGALTESSKKKSGGNFFEEIHGEVSKVIHAKFSKIIC